MKVSRKNAHVALRILSTKDLAIKGKEGRGRQGGGKKGTKLLGSVKKELGWVWLAYLLVPTCVSLTQLLKFQSPDPPLSQSKARP